MSALRQRLNEKGGVRLDLGHASRFLKRGEKYDRMRWH